MERHFSVQKSMRVSVNATAASQSQVWFVLHGYGQLSRFFLRKFDAVDPKCVLMAAPEGMHRFYLEGFSGRVGASWMTKEDRLCDIADYVSALERVRSELLMEFSHPPEVSVLGFSQGAATAVRWLCQGDFSPRKLVLWAGSFPEDVDFHSCQKSLSQTEVHVVVGSEDPFFSGSRQETITTFLDKHNIDYKSHEFMGSHDVDINTFLRISQLRPVKNGKL